MPCDVQRHPDVVVVGAGVAGLSAASALQRTGLRVTVLEAAGHIGGRCVTDQRVLGLPFDLGGSWLHAGPINPLAALAVERGANLDKRQWTRQRVINQGHDLTVTEIASYLGVLDDMWTSIEEAGADGPDVAASEHLPNGPIRGLARHAIAQWMAVDPEQMSCRDLANYVDVAGDWLIAGGLGTFVASLFQHVPVRLNCPVSAIAYGGDAVRLTTPEGEITASKVVVTASTSVLRDGRISFSPSLPKSKLDALEKLPCGLLNKIGIRFAPEWQEVGQGDTLDYCRSEAEACSVLFDFFGQGVATGFVAGGFAQELESEGPGAATSFCMEALKAAFGNDVTKSITATHETAWGQQEWTRGSYSCALPGGAEARTALATPVDDRLYFAGEATIAEAFATVHGAYLSGLRVAQSIVETDAKAAAHCVAIGD